MAEFRLPIRSKVEPQEMSLFRILKPSVDKIGARVGTISLPGRKPLQTPSYVGLTSRGAVPHLTPDMLQSRTSIPAIYYGLEDFIEKLPKHTPPLYTFSNTHKDASPLAQFTAAPSDTITIMGARRATPLAAPTVNSDKHIAICTSTGFRMLNSTDWAEVTRKLRPDIIFGLADVLYGAKASRKRKEKMGDRTMKWLRELMSVWKSASGEKPAIFAPILELEPELQWAYFEELGEDFLNEISGLVLYDAERSQDLPANLTHLPRFSMDSPSTPQEVLRRVALGVDVQAVPFINNASDAGIALDFSFPSPSNTSTGTRKSLGVDMWSDEHATAVAPLRSGCECYTCTKHHRAYLVHLLSAKEMLGWVLLQVHNHRVIDDFFAGIRQSIEKGTFEDEYKRFEETYEPELPAGSGAGPRLRGYQFKSEGPGEAKHNPPAFRMLNDEQEKVEDAPLAPSADADAKDLEAVGFAEKA